MVPRAEVAVQFSAVATSAARQEPGEMQYMKVAKPEILRRILQMTRGILRTFNKMPR